MSTKPVGVAIAGLGRSGWDIHARTLEKMPERFRIVSVLDPQPPRQEEAKATFGCRVAGVFEDFLSDKDVDLIVIATPSNLHADQTVAALKAGKHVVCEKPMATSLAEADRMIEAMHASGKLLSVFHNLRYRADFRKLREIIDSGVLGKIVQIRLTGHRFSRRWDWQTLKEFGGGTLNNAGAHYIDLALQLLGPAEPKVTCQMTRTLTSGDAEDHVKALLQVPGGATIDIEISFACAYPQGTWHVMGTSGGLRGSHDELEWKSVDFSKMPPRPVDKLQRDRTFNKETYEWRTQSWKNDVPNGTDYSMYWTELHASLMNNTAPTITAESVRRTMAVLETCRKAAGW